MESTTKMIADILIMIQNMNRNTVVTNITCSGDAIFADANINGILTVNDATESTDIKTGCVVLSGGLGVAKNANIDGDVKIGGSLTTDENLFVTGSASITTDAKISGSATVSGTLSSSAVSLLDSSSVNKVTLGATTGTDNYTLTFPTTAGESGKVLSKSTGNTLEWVTASGSGYDQDLNKTNDVKFNSVSATTGYTALTGYGVQFNDATDLKTVTISAPPAVSTTYDIVLPTVGPTNGQMMVYSDAATGMAWTTAPAASDQSVNTTSDVKFNSAELTTGGVVKTGFGIQFNDDSDTKSVIVSAPTTITADYNLVLPYAAPSSVGDVLACSSTSLGTTYWRSLTLPNQALDTTSSVTFNDVKATTGYTASTGYGVQFNDATDLKSVTLSAPLAVSTTYDIVLPATGPINGQMMVYSSAATGMTWTDGLTAKRSSGVTLEDKELTPKSATITVPETLTNAYTLTLPLTGPTANQTMVHDSKTSAMVWVDTPDQKLSTTSDVTFRTVYAGAGGTNASLTSAVGSPIVLEDTTETYYIGIKPHATTTASYEMVLPPAGGIADQYMALTNATNMGWKSIGDFASNSITYNNGSVTASGTDAAGATAVATDIAFVYTSVDNTKGIILPAPKAGQKIMLFNTDTTYTVNLYANAGVLLNGGDISVTPTILGAESMMILLGKDTTHWFAKSI